MASDASATARIADRALVRAFVSRFFENEISSSAPDLRHSFFGMLAVLGMPGALVPVLMLFNWELVGRFQGIDALRIYSRGDKVLYLGWSMIACAAVTVLVWSSLLIDRRDAFILGVAPLPSRRIVTAKLKALAIYVGVITLTMHTLASVTWGVPLALGRHTALMFFPRSIAAHFVASCLASATTLLTITAVQGLLVATLGPRWFPRVSGLLQGLLTVLVALAVFTIPTITTHVVEVLQAPGRGEVAWMMRTPPMWFLGIYEVVQGRADPVFAPLARVGVLAFVVALVVTVATHSVSYYRLMRGAIDQPALATRRSGRWSRLVARVVARRPDLRAVAEFTLATLSRVERHRLTVGVGAGIAVAFACPVIAAWPSLVASPEPAVGLLTLPIALMTLILAAIRVAISLPSDVKAGWLFESHRPSNWDVRVVIERLFFAVGVAPLLMLFLPIHWWLWGARVALVHLAFASLVGLVVIELLLQRLQGIPCARPWRPERAQLRLRWPVYLLAFVWLANGMPSGPAENGELELVLLHRPVALPVFSILILLVLWLRRRARRIQTWEPDEPEPVDAVGVLNLS